MTGGSCGSCGRGAAAAGQTHRIHIVAGIRDGTLVILRRRVGDVQGLVDDDKPAAARRHQEAAAEVTYLLFFCALCEHPGDGEHHEGGAGEGQVQGEGGGVVRRLGQSRQEGYDWQTTWIENLVIFVCAISMDK